MNKLLGYTAGTGIAVATVCLALYAGTLYGRQTAPEPCIANYHSTTPPWFARMEQELLENTEPYTDTEDKLAETPRDLMHQLVDYMAENAGPGERSTRIFTSPKDGKEYIVPGNCYVGKVNFWGEPTLYRGDQPDQTDFQPTFF